MKVAKRANRTIPSLRPAIILALEDGFAAIRTDLTGSSMTERARLTQISGYRPSVGDRVLVGGDADVYIIGVLHSKAGPAIELENGATASIEDGAIALRDPGGRLLVRYANDHAEIIAPTGDLELAAPEGAVRIRAATDVTVEAARDVAHHGGRRIALTAGVSSIEPQFSVEANRMRMRTVALEVEAKKARLAAGETTVFARRIATTAEELATSVERWELTATRIVERAQESFRDVAGLAQSRVGRARTVVETLFQLRARRTVMTSKDETTIDGKKILLG